MVPYVPYLAGQYHTIQNTSEAEHTQLKRIFSIWGRSLDLQDLMVRRMHEQKNNELSPLFCAFSVLNNSIVKYNFVLEREIPSSTDCLSTLSSRYSFIDFLP